MSRGTGLVLPIDLALLVAAGLCAAGIALFVLESRAIAGAVAATPILLLIGLRPEWGVALVVSIQAWDQILNPPRGSAVQFLSMGRVLTVLTVLSYSRIWLQRRPQFAGSRRILTGLLCFVLWCCVTLLWTPDKAGGIVSTLKLGIQFAFVYSGIALLSSYSSIRRLLFLLAFLTATAALYATFFGGTLVVGKETERLRLQGVGINSLATQFGFAILAAIGYVLVGKRLTLRIAAGFCVPVLAVGAMRCGTRAVFLGVPLALLAASGLAYGRGFHRYLLRGALIVVLLGGAVGWATHQGILGKAMTDRLLTVFQIDTFRSSPRLELAEMGVEYYCSHPSGTGIGAEVIAFTRHANGEAHNTFISVLVQLSVVGLVMLLGIVGALSIQVICIPNDTWRFIAMSLLIYLILQTMKSSLFVTRLFWLPILLILLIIEASAQLRLQQRHRLVHVSAATTRGTKK